MGSEHICHTIRKLALCYHESMNNLDEMTFYGIVHQVPIMQAEGFDFLEDLLKKHHVRRFLEIGTAIGRSAILAASLSDTMQVVTVERDPEMIVQARKNIEESGMADRITLIAEDALTAQVPPGPYDCIFIDAAKSQYTRFFERYSPLLAEDGIILTDNMNFHGLVDHPERTHNRHTKGLIRRLKAYRSFLENHPDFEMEIRETGDGLALTRRKKTC